MNILDLKKLMLVPLACCILVQQTDAKVVYSAEATKDLNPVVATTYRDKSIQGYAGLSSEKGDLIAERVERMIREMKKYTAWNKVRDLSMVGLAAFIPGDAGQPKITGVRVYLGGKKPVENGDWNVVPNNKPKSKRNNMALFTFNDYTHTERQLAACALFGAVEEDTAWLESADLKVDPFRVTRKAAEKLQGDLHIYTPAAPCSWCEDAVGDRGGIYCAEYYGLLCQQFPNVTIHVYFDLKELKRMSMKALQNSTLKEMGEKWSWLFSYGSANELKRRIKAKGLSRQVIVTTPEESKDGKFHLTTAQGISKESETQGQQVVSAMLREIVVEQVMNGKTARSVKRSILKTLFEGVRQNESGLLQQPHFTNLEFNCVDTE